MNVPFKTPGVPGLLTDEALAEQLKQFASAKNTEASVAPPPDAAVEFANRIQSEYLSKPAATIKALSPAAGPLGPLVSGLAASTARDQRTGPAPRDSTMGGKLIGNPMLDLMAGGTLAAEGTLDSSERQAAAQTQFEEAQKAEAAILKDRESLLQRQAKEREETQFGGLGAEVDEDARREALAAVDLRVAEAQKTTKEKKAALSNKDAQPTQTWWLSALQGGMREYAGTAVTAAKAPLSAWEGLSAALTGQTWEEKSDLREWVDVVDKHLTKVLPGDKTRSKELLDMLGSGSGSMAAYLTAGYIASAIGLPTKAATMAFGSGVGAQSQLEDAEAHDGVGLQKYLSFLAGGALGSTEAVPINRMFMRAEQASGGLVSRMLRNTAAGSMEEFVQEMGQSFGTDVVARWLYDENRDIDLASYAKQGLVGAIIGGAAGLATSVAGDAGLTPDQLQMDGISDADKTNIVERVLGGLASDFNALEGMTDRDAAAQSDQLLARVDTAGQTVKGAGGSIPVNAAGKFEINHWSGELRDVIDPAKRGTGPLRGAERSRLFGPDAVDRSYYGVGDPDFAEKFRAEQKAKPARERTYMQPTDPYQREGLGPYRHTVEVDPETIYNASEDPLDLRAQLDPDAPSSERITRMERLIKDAGFAGIYFPSSSLGQTAIMFDKQKPTRVYDERYGLPTTEIATPQDFAKPTADTFFDKGGWAVMTGTQEALGDFSAPENVEQNRKLEAYLQKNNIPYQRVAGSYQGVDQGPNFMVFMPEAEAVKLGKRFKQESVLTRRGLEYGDGRPTTRAIPEETIVGPEAQQNDFFSTLPDGTTFSMGLDFEGLYAKRAQLTEPQRLRQLVEQIPGSKAVLKYASPEEKARITTRNAQKVVDIFNALPDAHEMAVVAFSGRAKRGWYARSAKALVDIFGVEDAPRFAALLAALSPQTSVESNAVNALKMWTAWIGAGRPTTVPKIKALLGANVQGNKGEDSILDAWINNSVEALTNPDPMSIDLSGPKVSAFMNNLRGNVNAVTNDAWMANYANVDQTLFAAQYAKDGDRKVGRAGPGYIAMSAAVRRAAEVASNITGDTWTPAEIQETVWSWAKTLYEKSDGVNSAEQILKAGGLTAADIATTPDFASLFVSGVYRNILEQGGYDLNSIAESVAADGGGTGDRGDPRSAEGTTLAQRTFDARLGAAARRLDALRKRRAEASSEREATGQVDEPGVDLLDTFFPQEAEGVNKLGLLDDDDLAFLDEGLLASRSDVTQTPEFKAWFGDSKVVDADGQPLVVYHGTDTSDAFLEFDAENIGRRDVGFYGRGFYFTPDSATAEAYTEDEQGDRVGTVMPVYLSLEKPFEWDTFTEEGRARLQNAFTDAGLKGETVAEYTNLTSRTADKFNRWLRSSGYDGVIRYGRPDPEAKIALIDELVAFKSTQIKSLYNRGTFDPNDPSILAMAGTSSTRGAYTGEQTRPAKGVPSNGQEADTDLHLSSISADVVRVLDLTARQGRMTLKGASIMGQYSTRQDVVRVRTWDDLSTLVHEGGHALEQNAGPALQQFIASNETQLMQAATDLYGGDTNTMPKKEHVAEGFAEFFRVFTLNRAFAAQKYPQLTQQFIDTLTAEAPVMLAGLENIGKRFAAWLQLPSSQLVTNMVVATKKDQRYFAELRDAGFPTWFTEFTRQATTANLNQFNSLREIVTKLVGQSADAGRLIDLKDADNPYILARLMANSGSRAQVQLSDGVMGHRSVNVVSRSLREALLRYHGMGPDQNLGQIDEVRQRDFAAYLIALRGIDEYRRLDEGKIERPPLAATRGDLALAVQELDGKYGNDFRQAAEIVHEYGMALWKKTYDAGLMSKDTYRDGLERQFYAPLQRDMSDKKGIFGTAQTNAGGKDAPKIVKRFKGSDRRILDPMDVLMQKTFALEKSIAQNEVKKTLAALADKVGTAGALVERVPATQLIGKQYTVRDVARQLTKDDTLTEADAADLMLMLDSAMENDNVLTMFGSQQASAKGENIVFFWENGKVAAIQLKDGEVGFDVMNTLNGLGKETVPWFVDLIASTSSVFRSAITLWPDFLVVNFIRDQMSTWILSGAGFKPFVTGLKGAGEELRQGEWARQYNASMAAMGGMNVASLHRARVDSDIAALRRKGYRARLFNEGYTRGFARFAELTETGTRQGLYRKAFERAKTDGLTDWEAAVEAGYAATDIMDFGLHGSRTAIVRRTIPFFGAQLNGLYKMMRTLGGDEARQRLGLRFVLSAYFKNLNNLELTRRERQALQTGRKAWIKMASLGVFSAALHFLFEDDPDYQEAGEYLRTTGWVIPVGDGKIAYIPKPFELALLANFTERAIEFGSGDPQAKWRFLRGMGMTLTPPGSPPAIQIGVEMLANYDFFSDREIVPDYMQSLAGELQYNNYTSTIAKEVANVTGWSAMKVDHVLGGLGASAYRDISNTVNAVDPRRPAADAVDAPIVRRFLRDARRGSTSAQDFWRYASTTDGLLRNAETTYKTYLEAGNEQAANGFLETLDEDSKAYALLMANQKVEAKRLNPFYRNRQIATVISAMRRELGGELGLEDTTTKTSEAFRFTRRERRDADAVLSEIIRRETRNTLVYSKSPGWANRKPLDVEKSIEMLAAVEPRIAEELQRRLRKAKVYRADVVQEYWPEVKNRLLSDRENTFLKDIVTIAGAMR